MSNEIEFQISKNSAELYERYRKFIPCFNGCAVYSMCCEEKKASRGAKYLAYRIWLKNPCEKAESILTAIASIPNLYEDMKYHINEASLCLAIVSDLEEELNELHLNV